MPVGVGVGVAVGVGVGVIVGVGNGLGGVGEPVGLGEGGLSTTMRRGEITPHAAIIARRHNTQTTSQLCFGLERGSIVKTDASPRGTVAAGRQRVSR